MSGKVSSGLNRNRRDRTGQDKSGQEGRGQARAGRDTTGYHRSGQAGQIIIGRDGKEHDRLGRDRSGGDGTDPTANEGHELFTSSGSVVRLLFDEIGGGCGRRGCPQMLNDFDGVFQDGRKGVEEAHRVALPLLLPHT